jgi:hypothetical protein
MDSKGVTLPYASIYINRIPSNITNMNGIALIPFDKLIYGDTITSTFIGMDTASVVFTKKIQGISKCKIILNNDYVYKLDPVVVKASAQGGLKLFHNDVKTYNSLIFTSCIINGNFKAQIFLPSDGRSHNIEGTFILSNANPPKIPLDNFFKYNILQLPIIKTEENNTSVLRSTVHAITIAFNRSCKTISRINWEHRTSTKDSKVSYLGLVNDCIFFRFTYLDYFRSGNKIKQISSFQTIFSASKNTQEIETIESYTDYIANNAPIERKKMLFAICKKLEYINNGKVVAITVPERMEYNFKSINGQIINLILSNITIKVLN